MNKKNKVVISFDLDYTLINNRKGIINSFNLALRKFNLPPVRKSIIERIIGLPLDEMFSKFTDRNPSELSNVFRDYYASKGIYQSKLVLGVKNTLKELRAQDFILGVITSKKQNIAVKIVKYLKIYKFFDFILGESDTIKSKLDSHLTRLMLKTYPGHKFIIVGDHPKDAMLAKNLNSFFIGVLTGFHTKSQLEKARMQKSQILVVKNVNKISSNMIISILENSNLEIQIKNKKG